MKNDHRDELDDLIDGALPGYSMADPIDGLEDRVLRRIHASETAPRNPWRFGLAIAIPAVAALLLAGILPRMLWKPESASRAQSPAAPAVAAAVHPPSPAPGLGDLAEPGPRSTNRTAQAGVRPRRSTASATLPKEQTFPTPSPMTDQEHLLVAWAARMPGEVTQAFTDLQRRADEPVPIEEIQIQPLPSDGAK